MHPTRKMTETPGPLDASLRDFEPPPSPELLRHSSMPPRGYPYDEHQLPLPLPDLCPEEEEEEDLDEDDDPLSGSESGFVGGYSPPAWRRLGNGDRSSGFWRREPVEGLPKGYKPTHPLLRDTQSSLRRDQDLLEQAIRTRLPQGSLSPEKGRSVSPEKEEEMAAVKEEEEEEQPTMKIEPRSRSRSVLPPSVTPSAMLPEQTPEPSSPSENYIRFAVRAEVQQRTEPIETTISFLRHHWAVATSSRSSVTLVILALVLFIRAFSTLVQPAAPLPAGDLVKMAGVARSFEPLIYYSEHAVTQIQDLQATSVAVWDLGESVRTSGMSDADGIVSDLDSLSDSMKTLALEMTRFFARVDGDIDGILNVMDWARMHLNRLASSPAPSTLSSAYDNVHGILSAANILEDSTGAPTSIGAVTLFVFGASNPQREQRLIQKLFNEFLSVLEESIASELQHSVALFALFEAVDRHFLNLARTVVRETSQQEEAHADLLSGLWARILGPRAADVRKFEQNRLLLRDVRDKTVRNKGLLVEHNGRLLTLKASLESLRSKLVSPLVRGVNSTTLTLEDQIRGLGDVGEYLGDIRQRQKGKVMESLFGGSAVASRRNTIEDSSA